MAFFKKFFPFLDLGFTPNPVFIKGNHVYRSSYCAVVSSILILLFLIYAGAKIWAMTTNSSIEESRNVIREAKIDIDELPLGFIVYLWDLSFAGGKEGTGRDETIQPN